MAIDGIDPLILIDDECECLLTKGST
jgi:hypothetical protein